MATVWRTGGDSPRAFRVGPLTAAWVAALFVICSTAVRSAETCTAPLARVVVVTGLVELMQQGTVRLVKADVDAPLCAGDTVVVHQRSQATLLLSNTTAVRLDQGTTVTLSPPSADRPLLLNVVSGAVYVISRTPRPFRIKTPFINANVEGTEFLVEVRRRPGPSDNGGCLIDAIDPAPTEIDRVTVYEGRVQVSGDQPGAVPFGLDAGESAVATATRGPTKELVVRPRDAVTWTLYVPSIVQPDGPTSTPASCAAQLLAQGRLDDAKKVLNKALPAGAATAGRADSLAYALLATIAVAQNQKAESRRLADLAVQLDSGSAPALIARSYAQQAEFQIDDALASVRQADRIAPDAPRKARLAELELAAGHVDAALIAAQAAAETDPRLARGRTILGFVRLVQIDIAKAIDEFNAAILIDPGDPLARLGLGLARIRRGDLSGGRQEIELAAVLDTESSLIRSYLGKAYYEEKRDRSTKAQLALAKGLDPNDPTPWFYDAILSQADNRPVDAVRELQKSIELNDNRAVYRSRLMLDQDQAARMVSLARSYRMLGFDQLALLEAVKSLSLDPGDSSAHRFLAESYAGQVRSEAARVGELFQAQMRQPLGLNTISPQLSTDRRQIVEGAGPAQASSQEFTPLFNRDQVAVKMDGLAGNHRTWGDQVFVSGLHDRIAYSVGQYHFETGGLRPNNDLKRDVYAAFVQLALTPAVRVQAELRDDRSKQGDLSLRFDDNDFSRNLRDELQRRSVRIGGLVVLDPASSLLVSAIAGHSTERLYSRLDPDNFFQDRERLRAYETQYMLKGASFHVTTGVSIFRNRVVLEDPSGSVDSDERGRSVYAIAVLTTLPWGLRPELGLSWDTFEQAGIRTSRVNPKLGLLWTLTPNTTLRAAAFRTIKRSFDANQTLQPSQVYGFNQSYDDPNGTLSGRSGIALHHRIDPDTFIGTEWSARDSRVPGFPGDPYSTWTERFAKAYIYRLLGPRAALTAEFQYERSHRPEDNPGNEAFTRVRTLLLPVSLRFSWPRRWSSALQVTGVSQHVQSVDVDGNLVDGRDRFAVVDALVSYQLPTRSATFSVEAKNLFDTRFRYQEIDAFASPRVAPRRSFFVRVSTSF